MNNDSPPASQGTKDVFLTLSVRTIKGGGEVSCEDASIPVDILTRWERGADRTI